MAGTWTMTKTKLLAGAVAMAAAAAPGVASAQTRPGCETCPYSCAANYSYEYFSGYATNAVEGDLIMHNSPSVTKELLNGISSALGRGSARYTHVGLITKGGGEATHNTMFAEALVPLTDGIAERALQWAINIGMADYLADGDIDTAGLGAIILDGVALYRGLPGSHTANVETEIGGDGLVYWDRAAALIKPRDEGTSRHKAFRFADRERSQSFKYSVHAFMNPSGELGKGGSVCSLDVRKSSLDVGYGEPTEYFGGSAVQQGVNAGWQFVKNAAYSAIMSTPLACGCWGSGSCYLTQDTCVKSCDWMGGFCIKFSDGGSTAASFATNAANGMANQVSNCFKNGGGAGYNCTDWASTSWQSMGGTSTIVPDTFLLNLSGGTYKSTTTPVAWGGAGYRSYDNGTGRCKAAVEY